MWTYVVDEPPIFVVSMQQPACRPKLRRKLPGFGHKTGLNRDECCGVAVARCKQATNRVLQTFVTFVCVDLVALYHSKINTTQHDYALLEISSLNNLGLMADLFIDEMQLIYELYSRNVCRVGMATCITHTHFPIINPTCQWAVAHHQNVDLPCQPDPRCHPYLPRL